MYPHPIQPDMVSEWHTSVHPDLPGAGGFTKNDIDKCEHICHDESLICKTRCAVKYLNDSHKTKLCQEHCDTEDRDCEHKCHLKGFDPLYSPMRKLSYPLLPVTPLTPMKSLITPSKSLDGLMNLSQAMTPISPVISPLKPLKPYTKPLKPLNPYTAPMMSLRQPSYLPVKPVVTPMESTSHVLDIVMLLAVCVILAGAVWFVFKERKPSPITYYA